MAAGKAATQMTRAVHAKLPADITGLVVTRKGYADPDFAPGNLEIIEAAHPVPDAAGARAAQSALTAADKLSEGDLLLVLMSGGASALLPLILLLHPLWVGDLR